MSKVSYVIDEFSFLPNKMEQPKRCKGPVGEQGHALYGCYTVEELLERIIGDAYAIEKNRASPLCKISFQNGIGSLKK
jgi:hypothetical protein